MQTRQQLVGLLAQASIKSTLEVSLTPTGIAQAIKHLSSEEAHKYLTEVLAAAVFFGKTGDIPTPEQLDAMMG